jgi:hypothetical protein
MIFVGSLIFGPFTTAWIVLNKTSTIDIKKDNEEYTSLTNLIQHKINHLTKTVEQLESPTSNKD